MPTSKALVSKKLNFLNELINEIERMKFDEQSFVGNADIHDLVVFRLQQAVETCIDIATYIIAETDAPQKETAKDAFYYLEELRIIDKNLAFNMGKAADFRNRVVHGYNDFDFRILFKDYKEDLNDLSNFGAAILKYLESEGKSST